MQRIRKDSETMSSPGAVTTSRVRLENDQYKSIKKLKLISMINASLRIRSDTLSTTTS